MDTYRSRKAAFLETTSVEGRGEHMPVDQGCLKLSVGEGKGRRPAKSGARGP